jgi:hypothetical protein
MEEIVNDAPRLKLTPKDDVRAMLDRLPDSVGYADIAYHLGVLQLIREREADDRPEDDIPHEDLKRRMKSWRGR